MIGSIHLILLRGMVRMCSISSSGISVMSDMHCTSNVLSSRTMRRGTESSISRAMAIITDENHADTNPPVYSSYNTHTPSTPTRMIITLNIITKRSVWNL